jgi:amino acid adenylation domain-containing protein/thioester reductase-like protein
MDVSITKPLSKTSIEKNKLIKKWLDRGSQHETSTTCFLEEKVPLSFAQQRLWFLEQLTPNTPLFNIPYAVRLRGSLNEKALEYALNRIAQRHQVFRVSFHMEGEHPNQVLSKTPPHIRITVVDLLTLKPAEAEKKLIECLDEAANTPISLELSPLCRANLIKLSPTDCVFSFVIHHIIADGWSLGILQHELVRGYEAYLNESELSLPPLLMQYTDFSKWQHQQIQTPKYQAQLDYWRKKLHGIFVRPLISPDYQQSVLPTYRGERLIFKVEATLLESLKKICKEHKVTLFMLLLTAFKTLLFHYSGSTDIAVGCPIANRNRQSIEAIFGFFVNTLVIRSEFSEHISFIEYLNLIKLSVLEAYDNQDIPFERVVSDINPERTLSMSPLFNIGFVLHNTPSNSVTLHSLQGEVLPIFNGSSQLDITLSVTEVEKSLHCFFEFSTALYAKNTCEYLKDHFIALLKAITVDIKQPLKKINLLTATETQFLIQQATVKKTVSLPLSLTQRFEAIVNQYPNNVALIHNHQRMTYIELNIQANRVARYLVKQGVASESLIAIHLERSEHIVVAIIATLKIGATYVPIDTSWPAERIQSLAREVKFTYFLTEKKFIPQLPALVPTLFFDLDKNCYEHEDSSNLPLLVTPENRAYIIYTSGSTGKPKGVEVEHSNVCRLFDTTDVYFNFQPNDVWTLFHSIAFDFSVWELWGALLYGGALVIVPYHISRSPEDFFALLQKNNVTMLSQTPSAFKQLLNSFSKKQELLFLRYVFFGGEKLEVEALSPWFSSRNAQMTQLINLYGITETTVHVTHTLITKDTLTEHHSPIGRPLDDLAICLLDENQEMVPIGISGEIYVGGAGVARGYYQDPILTSNKFLLLPYPDKNKMTRFYRTGDLAVYAHDGSLRYLGRIDNQIKLRGFRIELNEILHILQSHPRVQDAFVTTSKDQQNHFDIVAYYIEKSKSSFEKQWQPVFDQIYEKDVQEASLNFSGWNSSYDGLPIPELAMREWLSNTLAQIKQVTYHHILELGCGTGLLLYGLIEHCNSYLGLDFSKTAILRLKTAISDKRVRLLEQPAHNLQNVEPNKYDLILLNSVIQYFPSLDYFIDVFERILKIAPENSTIFIGDVRAFSLLMEFYQDLEMNNPSATSSDDLSLIARIEQRFQEEHELVIEPQFFYSLLKKYSQISHVEVRLKKGFFENELTKFRYDVFITIGDNREKKSPEIQLNYTHKTTFQQIKTLIEKKTPKSCLIRNIPNKRLAPFFKSIEHINQALDPMAFEYFLSEKGYQYELLYIGGDKALFFDVALYQDEEKSLLSSGIQWLTEPNNSLSSMTMSTIPHFFNQTLQSELKDFLSQTLPSYMVPRHLISVQHFPLTVNGKIDQRALPKPCSARPELSTPYVMPITPLQKTLFDCWSSLLGIEQIGIYDNFFELGGHSLLASQLLFKLDDLYQVKVPLYRLFETPTIDGLAHTIEALNKNISLEKSKSFFDADARLTFKMRSTEMTSVNIVSNKTLMLTGATGFFGAFLLNTLLTKTEATILCLVRADTKDEGLNRILKNLALYQQPCPTERLEIILGDLEKSYLGLSECEFNHLSSRIDDIYHNASRVNFVAPYSEHKLANVQGMQEIIKLCNIGKSKKLHYISTTHVFTKEDAIDNHLSETLRPAHPEKLTSGYTQSKWVAEEMLQQAIAQGLDACIYRLGRIWGDHRLGNTQKNDFLWLIVNACLTMQIAPDIEISLDIIPADIASMAIFYIASRKQVSERIFHIINPNPQTWKNFIAQLNQFGEHIEVVSFNQWLEQLKHYGRQHPEKTVNGIISLLELKPDNQWDLPLTIGMEHTMKALKSCDWFCPILDETLTKNYWNFLKKNF